MKIEYEDVKRVQDESDIMGYRDTHPAFVTVSLSRISRGGRVALFGANSNNHPSSITLKVSKASRNHHLSRDWIHGHLKDYIEVEMTALQFSDLITSFNIGDGVPATLRYLNGQQVPYIPLEDKNEIGRIADGFKKSVNKVMEEEKLEEQVSEISDIIEKSKMSKKEKSEMIFKIRKMMVGSINSAKFVFDQFSESAEKVQSEAKREIDSFASRVLHDTGVQAIRSGMEPVVQMLAAPEDSDMVTMRWVENKPKTAEFGSPVNVKIDTIKTIRLMTGIGLKDAKDFVEGRAFLLPRRDADRIAKKFPDAGFEVES